MFLGSILTRTVYRTLNGTFSEDKQMKSSGEDLLSFIGKDKKEKISSIKSEANRIEKKFLENFHQTDRMVQYKLDNLHRRKQRVYETTLMKFKDTARLIKKIEFEEKLDFYQDVKINILLQELDGMMKIHKDREILKQFTYEVVNDFSKIGWEMAFPILYPLKNAISANLNLDEKIKEAEMLLATIKIRKEEYEVKTLLLEKIGKEIEETEKLLIDFNSILEEYIIKLSSIINKWYVFKRTNYKKYSDEEKRIVMSTFAIAQTIKTICDAPIVNEDGNITEQAKKIFKDAEKILDKIRNV